MGVGETDSPRLEKIRNVEVAAQFAGWHGGSSLRINGVA
jgi:hypothetical protein